MNKLQEKSNNYDNYKKFVYTQKLDGDKAVIHSVYFRKSDYRIHESCVIYSKFPCTIRHENGFTITEGCPMDSGNTMEILESMPRYNYKKLQAIAERIDTQL